MPDYNPAVALGVQPPQDTIPQTLNTINNLQIGQAHVGLYQLQLQQNAIEQNARQAAAQAGAHGEDMAKAYFANGGRDATLGNGYQSFQSVQRSSINGIAPAQQEQEASTASSLASAAKTRAEIPAAVAGSLKSQTEADATVAKTYAPGVLVSNGTDGGAYAQLVNGHFDVLSAGVSNNSPQAAALETQRKAALAVTDPQQRVAAAIRYGGAANVPVQDLAKTFNVPQPGGPGAQQPGQPSAQNALVGLRNPAEVEAASEQAKGQAQYYTKLYSGIQALGDTAANSKNDIEVAKAAIHDPNFMSGLGENYNLMYKKFLALGGSPDALPQEVFRKVMAANILQQTNSMKAAAEEMGANSTRLFASQIDMMEKAAQNPDNSIPSNQFLTEFADRVEKRNESLADSAADYKNGKLDPQFEKQFRKDASAPLFGQWELRHLNTIGAPMADKIRVMNAEDPKLIPYIRANPKDAAKIDAYYGPGTAKAVMGQ